MSAARSILIPAGPSPAATRPESFVALAEVRGLGIWGEPNTRRAKRVAQYWAERQEEDGRSIKLDGVWFVDPCAEIRGKPIAQYARALYQPPPPSLPELPANWKEELSEPQRKWVENVIELKRREDALRAEHPQLSRAAFEALLRVELKDWAQSAGLSLAARTRRRNYAKLRRRQTIQKRGRKPRRLDVPAAVRSPEAWARFRFLYLTPAQPAVTHCHQIVCAEALQKGWTWPENVRTVQLWVEKELPPAIADLHRKGQKKWARDHAPRIQRDYSQYRPMQLLVADHHEFDFLVLWRGKPVRPWLTAWMDMRSRYVVGWEISAAPNSDTIFLAFRNAVKGYGAPLEILIDNGKDFCAKGLAGKRRRKPKLDADFTESIMERLGIQVHWARPFNPQAKPIERFFETVCEGFSKRQPSYCGNSPENRPETLYRDLRAGNVEVPALEEVRAAFGRWLKDAYHFRPHSGDGMNGRTPADVFSEDPIALRTAPAEILDLMLMRTRRAKVTRHGVRHNGAYYGQGNLEIFKLHGKEVLLRSDPADAASLVVCDLQGNPLTVVYNQRLRGLNQDDIRAGEKRRKQCKKLAKAAMPAMRDAQKSSVDHAIAMQAEYLRKVQATGTDGRAVGDAPPRPFALLPGTADLAAGLRSRSRAAGPPPADEIDEPVLFEPLEADEPDEPTDFDWLLEEPPLFGEIAGDGATRTPVEEPAGGKSAERGDGLVYPIDLLGDDA